jgi:hypothetical protein
MVSGYFLGHSLDPKVDEATYDLPSVEEASEFKDGDDIMGLQEQGSQEESDGFPEEDEEGLGGLTTDSDNFFDGLPYETEQASSEDDREYHLEDFVDPEFLQEGNERRYGNGTEEDRTDAWTEEEDDEKEEDNDDGDDGEGSESDRQGPTSRNNEALQVRAVVP